MLTKKALSLLRLSTMRLKSHEAATATPEPRRTGCCAYMWPHLVFVRGMEAGQNTELSQVPFHLLDAKASPTA
jgi:hypothetical protein